MKSDRNDSCAPPRGRASAAFLLAQVGAHAASKFAARLRELDLAPPQAGIFRILSATPAITQQALASNLNMVPSRLVELLDELGDRGLIERREDPDDRRRYNLHLTADGRAVLENIDRISREHGRSLLASLNEDE